MCASSKNGDMGLFKLDSDSVFRLKSNFNTKIDPDFHHSQGGIKFASQISPLLLKTSKHHPKPGFNNIQFPFFRCSRFVLPSRSRCKFFIWIQRNLSNDCQAGNEWRLHLGKCRTYYLWNSSPCKNFFFKVFHNWSSFIYYDPVTEHINTQVNVHSPPGFEPLSLGAVSRWHIRYATMPYKIFVMLYYFFVPL